MSSIINNKFSYDPIKFADAYEKATSASKNITSAIDKINSVSYDASDSLGIETAYRKINDCNSRINNLLNSYDKWEADISELVNQEYIQELYKLLGNPNTTSEQLQEVTKQFMKNLVLINGNKYTNKLKNTNTPLQSLIAAGMPEELANNLSAIIIESNAKYFYSGEGAANAAYMFVGILAAYGLQLNYDASANRWSDIGEFAFGTLDNERPAAVCNTWVKALYRMAGVYPDAGSAFLMQ